MSLYPQQFTVEDYKPLLKFAKASFIRTYGHLNDSKIFETYVKRAFDPDSFMTEMKSAHSQFRGIRDKDTIIAYSKLNETPGQSDLHRDETLEVERIYVSHLHHRKGIGRLLIQDAIDRAKEKNLKGIWLGVWQKNQSAITFYERMGFVKDGTHSFYMGPEKQDDYIMYYGLN